MGSPLHSRPACRWHRSWGASSTSPPVLLLKRAGGRPAPLLVRGDAGIGFRLVAELALRSGQLGHSVVAGRKDDLDHGILHGGLPRPAGAGHRGR